MTQPALLLVYDKECPVCDMYCRLVRIRESVGDLQIVDARDDSEVLREITDNGLDIDQGMVLKMGDRLYYGADAIHMLALISQRSGVFNRFNYWLFSSQRRSRVLYPVFRSFRNLLLKLLGKTRINNLGIPGNETF
ncbi:DCC1-like thiol-disulfide oxidoreductase family protein [Thiohalophilus thiocyanatoxydans]|uniref:Putative DCC family thiol-disulfide oxidoreductase YuxK n=1 Tax=Thiohalophilus thiocyanatoxydans TaxID=381308 RepID=A0A4R8J1G9_9GAMM|nr:DCC1-like thiol-disulfide oxidoreductase family protein [Thiohalophilus thiocyanatoxydans]TDY04157.1 putative DCC family thiol-disulfide oxidoreductase YuxK [Thiohalophilus thiocyanatoxydans]